MKSINKTLFRFCFISLSISFILCLTSCFNLFLHGSEDDADEQTVTFKGYINVDSSFGSDFLNAIDTQGRSAVPDLTVDGTEYEYYVEATKYNADDTLDTTTTITPSVNTDTKAFEVGLQHGKWKIDVCIRTVGGAHAIVLNDTWTTPDLDDETPVCSHEFFLKAYTSSSTTGGINLTMTVPSTVAKVNVTVRSQPAGATLTDSTHARSGTTITYHPTGNFPTGQYELLFTFYKVDDTPVFSTEQTINVLNTLTTNHWTSTTSVLIKSDGTFELTAQLINAWRERRTEYYVGGTGAADTNQGGPLNPLATVKRAVALVNDIPYDENTTVKIHMADGTHEEVSESITINNGKKVAIDAPGNLTDIPSLVRAASFVDSVVSVNQSAELTINDIIIDGNNVNLSTGTSLISNWGKVTINSGKLQNNKYYALYNRGQNSDYGTLIINGGTITGNKGAVKCYGIFIMNGGTITANKAEGLPVIWLSEDGTTGLMSSFKGGVITGNYSSHTTNNPPNATVFAQSDAEFSINGPVQIYDNYECPNSTFDEAARTPLNVYLQSGKTIKIGGYLTKGTDNANVWVTTITKPTAKKGETAATTVTFTNNYISSGNQVEHHPGEYFHSDEGYAVVSEKGPSLTGLSWGDSSLAVSGGTLSAKAYEDVQFTFTGPDTIFAGTTGKQTVTVKKNDTELEEPTLTFEFLRSYGSDCNTSTYRTFDKNEENIYELTLLSALPEGKYTAGVSIVDNGIKYTGTKTFTVAEKEKTIASGNFNTSATLSDASGNNSKIFIKDRSNVANIRPLIAGTHEVTQAEYEMYCIHISGQVTTEKDYYPVNLVTWYDAIIYCNLRTLGDETFGDTREKRLLHCVYAIDDDKDPVNWPDKTESNGKYGGPSSSPNWDVIFDQNADGWRLPTEAEWEYLARGGNLTTSNQTTYSGSNTLDDVAWHKDNSDDKIHKVCTKSPNALGLYDMTGNVFEWVWDKQVGNPGTGTPATGPETGTAHVIRGGSYDDDLKYCKLSERWFALNYITNRSIGFRVVRNAQ